MNDYSQWTNDSLTPGQNLRAVLTSHADEVDKLAIEIEALEELLTEAKSKLRELTQFTIPQLLDGLEGSITLDDGRKVEVKETVRASIKNENKPAAMQWLRENGHDSIIKNQIIVSLGKGREEEARKIMDFAAQFEGTNVKNDKSVHAQTLGAWVREQLKAGVPIPHEVFGVFKQSTTKIKEA